MPYFCFKIIATALIVFIYNRAYNQYPITNSPYPIPNHPKYNYNDIYRRFWQLNITTSIFAKMSLLVVYRIND